MGSRLRQVAKLVPFPWSVTELWMGDGAQLIRSLEASAMMVTSSAARFWLKEMVKKVSPPEMSCPEVI